MEDQSITARMGDYFRRQIELFKQMSAAEAGVPAEVESQEWERAQAQQERFERELGALEEEFWILKREWDASSNIEPQARAHMQELAASAMEMAESIARANARNALRISEMMQDTQEQWATLQRGKRMLRNLRAGEHGDAGYIDRKA
jgi:hypothetical protein